MNEEERKELNSLNREILLLNTEYEEMKLKLSKLGERIFRFKQQIEQLFNGD